MHHALAQFHVDGLGNNIAFLDRLVLCDSFKNANLDTGLIQREEEFLLKPATELNSTLVVSAAFIELLSRLAQNPSASNPVWQTNAFWRLNLQSSQTIKLQCNDKTLNIQFAAQEHGFVAQYEGQTFELEGQLLDAHTLQFKLAGKQQKLAFSQTEHGITLFQNGQSYKFAYLKPVFNQEDDQGAENNLTAPMPGVITQVLVAANDKVKKDDVLMTLEAMKIEYSIRAPHDGIVASSYFQAGDQVKAGDELVEFQPLAEEVA